MIGEYYTLPLNFYVVVVVGELGYFKNDRMHFSTPSEVLGIFPLVKHPIRLTKLFENRILLVVSKIIPPGCPSEIVCPSEK